MFGSKPTGGVDDKNTQKCMSLLHKGTEKFYQENLIKILLNSLQIR